MKVLIVTSALILTLSGCTMSRQTDAGYKEMRCKQLLSRTEYPALREIQRVQARTEAAQLGCFK